MYRLAALIVAGVAAVTALAVYAGQPADPGDDPPLLKKKAAPDVKDPAPPPADDKDKDKDKKPDAPKPDAGKGQPDQPPRPDPDEVLKGVSKSMHQIVENLAKKNLSEATRQAEDDALKGLDSLIDLAENPPQDPDNPDDKNSSSNSSDSSSNKSDSSKSSSDSSKSGSDSSKSSGSKSGMSSGSKSSSSSSSSSSGRRGKGRKGSRSGSSGNSGSQPGAGGTSGQKQPGMGMQGDQPQDSGNSGNKSDKGGHVAGGGNNEPQMAKDPNADLYKDVWGHLPETLRAEMNAYSNTKGFMPEYEALISKYYSTIAEQGRRKGD